MVNLLVINNALFVLRVPVVVDRHCSLWKIVQYQNIRILSRDWHGLMQKLKELLLEGWQD
jgi:hypothetical protein